MITGKYPSLRLRRTRKYNWSRRLIQENNLSSSDLIYPIFIIEGKNIFIISLSSPVGKNLFDKKKDESISINNVEDKIIEIL